MWSLLATTNAGYHRIVQAMLGTVALALLGTVAAVLLACGDSGSATPGTATMSAQPIGTAVTATAATSQAASATADHPSGLYARGKRSGVGPVDRIIGAVENGDSQLLESLVVFQQVACEAAPSGVGAAPKCAQGEAPGQRIEVLQGVQCEGTWIRRSELAASVRKLLNSQPPYLYAVYKATPTDGVGAAYGLLFAQDLTSLSASGMTIDQDGHITKLHMPCGQVANQIRQGTTFLVPPSS